MPDSTPKDLLTPKTAAIILAPFAAAVIAGRMHPEIVAPITLALTALCVFPIVDRFEAKRRMVVGTIAAVLLCYTLAIIWPWGGPAVLVPVAVPLLAIWCIGSGHDKRTVPKATAYLPGVVDKHLPVGVTRDKPILRGGKLSMILKAGPSAPKGAMADFDRRIASALTGTKRGAVKVIDLGAEMGEGYYRLEVGQDVAAFTQPLKPRPAVGEWPGGMIPIGEYGDGAVCYIGRWHTVIAAETRAGKSVLLENIIWGRLTKGDTHLVLLDPKVVEFATYQNVAGVTAYADEPATMTAELARLTQRMDSRYQAMKLKGVKTWTADMGPFVCCVVDETFDLLALAPEAWPHLERLYQKAAAAGIQMVCATQRPDAQSIPPLVKANAPTLIGLRVANATAERTLWEDAKDRGVKLNDRKRPDGRAYVETVGRDGADVQIYPSPGTTGLATVTPSHPPINPTPSAGETNRDTPVTPQSVTGGVTPSDDTIDGTIADALQPYPQSIRAIADAVDCHPETARRALLRLEQQGRACRRNKGWIDALFASEDAA